MIDARRTSESATLLKNTLFTIFHEVDEQTLERLGGWAVRMQYAKGDLVVQEGSAFTGVYLVTRGLLNVGKYASIPNKFRTLRILGPGEFFGLETLMVAKQQTNLRFARALLDSELYFFRGERFLAFLRSAPQGLASISNFLARELAMQDYKLTRDAYEGDLSNLASFLFDTCDPGLERTASVFWGARPTRSLLASILGISEQAVIKLLKQLKDRKIISVTDEGIEILEFKELERLSNNTVCYHQTPKTL